MIFLPILHPYNKVTKLGVSGEPRTDGYSRTEVGREVGSFYGYVYDGIFQSQAEIDNRVMPRVSTSISPRQTGDVAYADSITTAKSPMKTVHTWVVAYPRFILD